MRLVTFIKDLFGPPPPVETHGGRVESDGQKYGRRFLPSQGRLRCGVLQLLYVEKPGSPYHLPLPPEDANLDEVVLRHLEGIWQRELPRATGPQFNHLAVVAAGLLTFGRLEMADYVLENLPPHRIEMDMFAGWGNVFAFRVTAAVIPVPEPLRDHMHWFEGSDTAKAVRAWFAQNRDRLEWNATERRFELAGAADGPA